MAVGSNTLGLLFKVGVDAKDATQQLQQMASSLTQAQRQIASTELGNAIKELNSALKTNKDLTDEQKATIKAAIEVVQQYKDVIDSTSKAFKQHQAETRQTVTHLTALKNIFQDISHANFGDAISAIGKALLSGNPLIIAMVGAAIALGVAILAAKKAIDEFRDAVQKVGTESRDDFKQLQEELARVGEQLTLADHALAQGILKSFKDLSSAVTAFFVNVMRPAGPALITLMKDLTNLVKDLIPYAEKLGNVFKEAFISISATLRTLDLLRQLGVGALLLTPGDIAGILGKVAEQVRKEVEAQGKSLKDQTGTFKDEKKKQEDMVATSLEAQLKLVQENQKAVENVYEATIRDITQLYRAGAVDRVMALEIEEFARKRLLDQTNANTTKQIDLETQLAEHQKKRALTADEIAARDQAAVNKRYEDQKKINAAAVAATKALDDADKEEIKRQEARLDRLDKILEKEKELDQIVRGRARAAQEIPGGGGVGPIPGAPAPIPLPSPTIIKDLNSLIADLNRKMVENIKNAIAASGAWGGFTQTLKEMFSLQNIADQFVLSMKSILDVFIQTGHTGPAVLRQLVAGVLRAIAEMSAEWGAFFLLMAIGFAALGDWGDALKFAAAGAGLVALAAGLGWAASKVGPSQAGAAAGAGTFGGTEAAPGTVTINQGAVTQLGLLQSIDNHLSNISTAPPGDVLQRGADQNPMVVGQANNEAARRDGTVSRQFLEIAGLRPA